MAEIYLTRGKGDFVQRIVDGEVQEVCNNLWNADASAGCISQVPPALVEEVMANKGKYTEATKAYWKKNFGKIPDERCWYCYARGKNKANVAPKTVGKKTRKEFEEKRPDYVRLSKNTEFGHKVYRKSLIDFLDLCSEFGARPILPTKMLEFDLDVRDRIIESDGVISYSLGYNFMEPGVIGHGFTNKERIKQAEIYRKHGANVTLTLVGDITDSIRNNARRGSAVLDFLDSDVMAKRIIPIRLNDAKIALKVTGIEWNDLKNPEDGIGHIGGWEKYPVEMHQRIISRPYIQRESNNGGKGNNTLIARFVHEDFQVFEEERRICGQVGEFEYCDKCNLTTPEEFVKFPVIEISKVIYNKNTKRKNKKAKDKTRNGMTKQPIKKKLTIQKKLNFN